MNFVNQQSAVMLDENCEIIVVGSANIDLVTYVRQLPRSGETIMGNAFVKKYGGKGANQAVIISRFTRNVTLCASVGNDDYGNDYIRQLLTEGCGVQNIVSTSEASTGVACITVSEDGSNTIVINPGANFYLTPAHVRETVDRSPQTKVLVCQNEVSHDTTKAALHAASESGAVSIFNPAPMTDREKVMELCQLADVVCPNETELYELIGESMPVDTEEEIVKAAEYLLSMGTMSYHLSQGTDLSGAVQKAVECAALSVTRQGAQESYPSRDELRERNLINSTSSVCTKEEIRAKLMS